MGVCILADARLPLRNLAVDAGLTHAEGANDFALADDALLRGVGGIGRPNGTLQTRPAVAFIQQGQQEKQDAAGQC